MNRHSEITVEIPVRPEGYFSTSSASMGAPSPVLKFASGPSFQSKPFELDLRNLPSIFSSDIDQSLRALIVENLKPINVSDGVVTNAQDDSEDNMSVVSEVSTCSSAVTLETVDEGERPVVSCTVSNRRRSNSRVGPAPEKLKTSPVDCMNCPSSSEAEDCEDGHSVHKSSASKISARLSELFTTGSGSIADPKTIDPTEKVSVQVEPTKKRRSSITRRIPPAISSIFSSGNPSSAGGSKTEPHTEKELKKLAQPRSRKLSLTMFHKPSAVETKTKRRNTDPSIRSAEMQELKSDKQETVTPEKKEQELPEVFLKEDDVKIRDLIEQVLRAHLLTMREYRRDACDRAGKSICKILKTLVSSMKETAEEQCKVVCQSFIGAVKEEGILTATQAFWNSDDDNFAAASFRNDSVFGLAVVISTPVY